MPSQHNLRFALVCLLLFVVGAVLRVRSGWLTLPWLTQSPTPSASAATPIPLPPGLGDTVLNFYRWLDRGAYPNAYQVSLENKWQTSTPDTVIPNGLVSQDEFVRAATEAWGVNGADLTINEIGLESAAPLDLQNQSPVERPELYALAALAPKAQVADVYEVGLRGSLIERCSAWQWSKHLLVARFTDGDWKILLPGVPDPQVPLLQALFLDQNPFDGLHIQEK